MNNIQIGIAGCIASGKTTIAKAIAQNYGLQYLSFSGVLKHYCLQNDIVPSRVNLQNLGQRLVDELGQKKFMHWIMQNTSLINWKNGFILDGFRHEGVFKEFKQIFPRSLLLFCDCSEDTQIVRICQRDHISENDAQKIIKHTSEKNVNSLKGAADFVFTSKEKPEKLISWITNETKIPLTNAQKRFFINSLAKES